MTKQSLKFHLEENTERTEVYREVSDYILRTEEYIQELKKANRDTNNLDQKVKAIMAENDMLKQKERLTEVTDKYPRTEIVEVE